MSVTILGVPKKTAAQEDRTPPHILVFTQCSILKYVPERYEGVKQMLRSLL